MSNILDYIAWRGDLPFSAAPFNEVDALILAQLSMMRWENGLGPGETAQIRDVFEPMNHPPVSVGFTPENDLRLLRLIAPSVRFGGIVLRGYERAFDERSETQFAAVTLELDDGTAYVSFRGTDSSLVGWKEDCNMAFARRVPAQESAQKYLEAMAHSFPGRLRVGGHSKGGNLAIYAAASASAEVLDRIIAVYNHDGPGLSDKMNADAMYGRIRGRLYSFVPQYSIVGMLLNHPDAYTVVKSNSVSIFQHDPYSWQVEGPAFVHMPGLTRESARFDAGFRAWLGKVDDEDRELLIDSLFDVLSATQASHFGPEFWQGLARNPKTVIAAIQDINSDQRKRITRMLTDLGAATLLPGEKDDETE